MKRKRFLAMGSALMLLGSSTIVSAGQASTDLSREEQVSQWYEAVQQEYSAIQSGGSEEEIRKYGFEAAIKAYEIEYDHETAVEKAKEFYGQQMALYLAALENGVKVTDEEVADYIEEYKTLTQEQGYQDEGLDLMASFPSEGEFWDYEEVKCIFPLTVKKYLTNIGSDYAEEMGIDVDSKFLPIQWYEKLDKAKAEALEKYKEEIEAMFTE